MFYIAGKSPFSENDSKGKHKITPKSHSNGSSSAGYHEAQREQQHLEQQSLPNVNVIGDTPAFKDGYLSMKDRYQTIHYAELTKTLLKTDPWMCLCSIPSAFK
jgi:hypothetical protein